MKKRKDGRYFVTRKIGGKSVSIYGKTREEVYRKLEERMNQAEGPKTFAEIAQAWYDAKWDNFAYGTQNCYRSAYSCAIDALGDIPNNEVIPHQFRHAYATMLYDAGIDVKMAQKLLGHSSTKMTQDIYTHIRESCLDDVAAKLNTHIGKQL